MGLSLDTSFSADLLASGSTDYIRHSGEEPADTPFQLPDYSGQEEPEISPHPQDESSASDAEPLMSADSDDQASASEAESLLSVDAVTSEGAEPAAISGDPQTASHSLSALPESMIWMQPQDFQALLRADQAMLDANAEVITPTDGALLEQATDPEVGSDSGDGMLSHTTPTSAAQDSSSGVLSASAQASTLALWMMAPILTTSSLSSASASSTATDSASSLSALALVDGADAATALTAREGALTTSAASPPVPLATSLNSNLSRSSASPTQASALPQTTATTLGDGGASTHLAAAASPVLQSTAEAAASQRQSAQNPALPTTTLPDSGTSMSFTSATLFSMSPTATAFSSPLVVDSSSASWGQQLVSSLGERVQLQANQQIQQATIRLDPPELGRLEVTVRQEHDRLSVQISTSNSALRDALQETREQLRQILIPQYGAGVEVEINYSGDGRQQAQTEALLEEEIVSNGITFATGQEVAETAGAVVNSGLLDTWV